MALMRRESNMNTVEETISLLTNIRIPHPDVFMSNLNEGVGDRNRPTQ
jgi:hypothetical protein